MVTADNTVCVAYSLRPNWLTPTPQTPGTLGDILLDRLGKEMLICSMDLKVIKATGGKNRMKILGICGSPRDGNTTWIMEKVFKDISKENVEDELIQIKNMHIELCDGCLACEDTEQCSIDDDMNVLYEKLSQCDRIVIGTPVYFDSIPALLKNFIDRLNPLCVSEKLKNKDLYLIVIGQLKEEEGENSRKKVIDYIRDLCEIFGMTFHKAWGISAREPKETSKLENIGEVCEEIKREIYG